MVMLCKTLTKQDLYAYEKLDLLKKYVANIKFDGDRIIYDNTCGKVVLKNRRGMDVTAKYPEVPCLDFPCILDGEMCVFINGKSEFMGIQHRSHNQDNELIQNRVTEYPVTYVIFDVLELSGLDLKEKPVTERAKVLNSLKLPKPFMKAEFTTEVIKLWETAVKTGEEGIILKERDSKYEDKRSNYWIKVKNQKSKIITFKHYTIHNKGIRLTTNDKEDEKTITVNCAGYQSRDVKNMIDKKGEVKCIVNYLGETSHGKLRMPVFECMVNMKENEKM